MSVDNKSKRQRNVAIKSARKSVHFLSMPLPLDSLQEINNNGSTTDKSRKRQSSCIESNIASKRSRSHFYSPTETTTLVEKEMKKFHRLHFLLDATHSDGEHRTRATKTEGKANDGDKYEVENIIGTSVRDRQYLPVFKVKCKGSDTTSWESLDNLYDCHIFTKYTERKMVKHREQLDGLWSELTASRTHVSDALMSDEEAIAQIIGFDAFLLQWDLILLIECRMDAEMRKVAEVIQSRCEATLRLLPYLFKRFEQLRQIYVWQIYINKCDKSSNLCVENEIDFEVPPEDFEYTNDVIAGEGVIIPNDPPIGCECAEEGGCNKKSKCCGAESIFAYNKNRLICVPQGTPVFECNKRCKCGAECMNRVLQLGRKHTLTIFKTSNGCGWGVRTDKAIPKGQFVCEYVGEVITEEETERRGKIYDANGLTYLFDLDVNRGDSKYSIDAAHYGNVSRFINHSCNPNVGVWTVWTDCLDANLPKIGLFTLRNIAKGEEISIDYTGPVDTDHSAEGTIAKKIKKEIDESEGSPKLTKRMECKCGAENCRKFLF